MCGGDSPQLRVRAIRTVCQDQSLVGGGGQRKTWVFAFFLITQVYLYSCVSSVIGNTGPAMPAPWRRQPVRMREKMEKD